MDAGWHRARLTSRARATLLSLMLVEKSLTVSGGRTGSLHVGQAVWDVGQEVWKVGQEVWEEA